MDTLSNCGKDAGPVGVYYFATLEAIGYAKWLVRGPEVGLIDQLCYTMQYGLAWHDGGHPVGLMERAARVYRANSVVWSLPTFPAMGQASNISAAMQPSANMRWVGKIHALPWRATRRRGREPSWMVHRHFGGRDGACLQF